MIILNYLLISLSKTKATNIANPIDSLILNGRLGSIQLRTTSINLMKCSIRRRSQHLRETKEAHIFKADMPGMKEEVKIEVEDDRVLQISGERSREVEESSDRWHRVERSSGKFMRRFRLPENVKMDKIKAAMENGVLTVTVPKDEGVKRDPKSIEISG